MSSFGGSNPLLLASAAGGGGGYEVSRSLRFNSADSAYLSRTPGSAGNRKTWTWAGWVKRSGLGTFQYIWGNANSSAENGFMLRFDSGDVIRIADWTNTAVWQKITSQVFRDVSAWYHIVISYDTTNATAADRVRLYVNGTRITAFSTSTDPTQNYDGYANNTSPDSIGRWGAQADYYLNGYLADIHFIDGQALDPTSFGEFDTNGVWQPIAYAGSYGTNGFHLDFADNSSAAALGYDAAGSNDWTVNNIQATAPTYTYSSGWTANLLPGFPATNCFNGTGTSLTIGGNSVASVWTAPTSLAFTELRVRGGHDGAQILINGVNVTSQFASSVGWVTVTGVSSPLSTITLDNTSGAGNARISAVVVDGDMLVDGRPFKARDIDSLRDSPTNGNQTDTGVGGEVVGNYATLNPLVKTTTTTLSNGNLDATSSGQLNAVSTFVPSSGKWYWEITLGTIVTNSFIGLYGTTPLNNDYLVYGINGYGFLSTGFGSASSTVSGTGVAGDVIGLAFDVDAKTLQYYKNGSSIGTISGFTFPANWSFGISCNATVSTPWSFNFGARSFAFAAPSGFKALCTANLPAPTITNPSTVMDVKLYTGNSSTQTISGLGFSPDLVWLKQRTNAENHGLFDTVRGAQKSLCSNNTNAENTTDTNSLTAFTSDGFSLGNTSRFNDNTYAHVAWAWDAGTSNAPNTDGTIASTVRANISAGFSIVTWTGTGSNGTLGHGLGVQPHLVIIKARTNGTEFWFVWHKSLATNFQLALNTTGAAVDGGTSRFTSAPSSSLLNLGTDAQVNANGTTYVAYCFAPVAGYSAFGSYVGTGSGTTGPFVYTGMRPRWILIKRTDSGSTNNWVLHDTARSAYNVATSVLYPNLSNAEDTTSDIDILSNGFRIRDGGLQVNASSGTYVWAAFAEHPFALARAR